MSRAAAACRPGGVEVSLKTALIAVESTSGAEQLWQDFLVSLCGKLSSHVLDTWLRPVRCRTFDGETAVLEVRDLFFRDWLADHYLDVIRHGLGQCVGHPVAISWQVNGDVQPAQSGAAGKPPRRRRTPVASPHAPPPTGTSEGQTPTATGRDGEAHEAHEQGAAGRRARFPARARQAPASRDSDTLAPLSSRYCFDSFVCGPSNQFALAACRAAADKPGLSYNPLFIFGGVGLGKTHLLHAIGHQIRLARPQAKILYASSEQFTNEVINAVLRSRLEDFRSRYQKGCDVILMDDIQLIAGKERTQHEFFHMFNTLYDTQRQIVVTSDKLPHEIPDIEERLRNRFQWGLIADVQPPETETRVAILRQKAASEGIFLPDDVAFLLARSIRSNVRELEGALVRIIAHSSLTGSPLTVDYAKNVLSDVMSPRHTATSVEAIQRAVAVYFKLRPSDLKSKSRLRAMVRPRQIAMHLCRKHTSTSFPELGARFGHKDHSTVMVACHKTEERVRLDPATRGQVQEIERLLDLCS